MCIHFTTTPDVAVTLLGPELRELTLGVLEARRAERVIEEFRSLHGLADKEAEELARRWRESGDGEFLKEILEAAGFEQPAMDAP